MESSAFAAGWLPSARAATTAASVGPQSARTPLDVRKRASVTGASSASNFAGQRLSTRAFFVPARTEFSVTCEAPPFDASPESTVPESLSRKPQGRIQRNGSGNVCHTSSAPFLEHEEIGTAAVHAGERNTTIRTHDMLTVPIASTAVYTFPNTQAILDYYKGGNPSFEYGRYGNPTVRAAEDKIRALEHAEEALLSATGMCTATTLMQALLEPGQHIITTSDCYKKTRQFIKNVLGRTGVTHTVIEDDSELEAVLKARGVGNTAMFFSESPTNPYLNVIDIPKVARACHQYGALVVIDSTFVTAVNQLPLELGADLVVHSATKYMAGHNDTLAGALAGRQDLVQKVRQYQGVIGGTLDAMSAYLLIRGLKTMPLRVRQQNETALKMARFLEAHPMVERVFYPGLESHPQHEVARRQMKGFGGVVSFHVKGDVWQTARVVDSVRIPYIAPSLGGVESLISQPSVMSYWEMTAEQRLALGLHDNLIRYSVGIEDADDLIADLKQALDTLAAN